MDEQNLNNNDNNFEKRPKLNTAGLAILSLIFVFILYQFGGGLLTISIVGLDLEKADKNSIRLLTAAGQILFILLPALILTRIYYADVTNALRFRNAKLSHYILFPIGMVLLFFLVQSYMYIQTYLIEIAAKEYAFVNSIKNTLDSLNSIVESSYKELLTPKSLIEGFLIFFIVTIVPSVCEEVFFRGFIQKSFELRYRYFKGALLSAIFFGLYHFNPYGLIPLIGLGLYFGFAAYISNSIAIPVLLHFLNNFTSLLIFFIVGSDELNTPNIGEGEIIYQQIGVFIFFTFLFSGFIYYVLKNNSKQKMEEIL